MTTMGYVLLGDVVGSREIADRASFQERIEAGIEAVNRRYQKTMVAPVALVKGVDEVAGVLDTPGDLYRLLSDLVSVVRPGAIRFAVVYGEIDVGATGDDVGRMDGPAFHRADEALAGVSDAELYVTFEGRAAPFDPLVGAGINLLLMARERWTDRQRAMVQAYEAAGTQGAVADQFGVSQQAVSATLQRADWHRLARLEAAVNGTLERYETLPGRTDAAIAPGEAG